MPSDVHPAAGFTGGSDVTGCLSGLVSGGFGASLCADVAGFPHSLEQSCLDILGSQSKCTSSA